jgi:hypothetical protein
VQTNKTKRCLLSWKLERVEEEEEAGRGSDGGGRAKGTWDKLLDGEKQEEEDLLDSEEEIERRRDDLGLGRPRTPERSGKTVSVDVRMSERTDSDIIGIQASGLSTHIY